MTYHELVAKVLELPPDEQRTLIATVTRSLAEVDTPRQVTPSLAARLRGVAKSTATPQSDKEAEHDYTAYLTRKHA